MKNILKFLINFSLVWTIFLSICSAVQAQNITGTINYTDLYSSRKSTPTGCQKGSATECVPYCKYEKVEECFLCPVFAVVFNTVSNIGDTAVTTFSSSVGRVVVVAFGIWLAIQILLFASSPETRDLKDLIQSIITQSFIIILVVAILETGVANFFKTFINPVYTTGQSMAQTMFEADTCSKGKDACNEDDSTLVKKEFSSIRRDIKNGLPPSMGNSILQTMTMMENRLRKFKALGSGMMCQSWKEGVFIFPSPILIMTGFAIWVICMALIIGVPFLMVDSVFQLSVAVALLPMAVGCFAFKSTRQYSKKVWETFLNSMFAFLFISVIIIIVLGTIQSTVVRGINDSIPKGIEFTFEDMFTPDGAKKTNFSAIVGNFSWASPHFLRLIFVFVLAWTVMQMAKELAGEFADSISSTSIGSSIGTMAASTAKGMATKLGGATVKAAAKETGREAINLAKQGVGLAKGLARRGKQAYRFREKKYILFGAKRNVQRDTNGNKTVEDKKNKRTYSMENGIYRERSDDEYLIRANGVTLTRTKSTENGKTVFHDEVKISDSARREIFGADGRVDGEKMAGLLKGLSGDDRKLMQGAIVKTAMEQRFSKSATVQKRGNKFSEVKTDGNGVMVLKEIDSDGNVRLSQVKLNSNGYLETTMTKINKDGAVTCFYSDGIRTKMETFALKKGTSVEALNNVEEVYVAKDKEKKSKVSYGYTKFWQNEVDNGLDENQIPLGAMPAEEIYGETVIMDKKGNIIGRINEKGEVLDADGHVVAHRSWFKADIKDKDGNVMLKYGDYKEKKRGGQFYDFVHSKGNEFQKGDMEWYFR